MKKKNDAELGVLDLRTLEALGRMTILEASELVRAMEEKFGVSHTSPVAEAGEDVVGICGRRELSSEQFKMQHIARAIASLRVYSSHSDSLYELANRSFYGAIGGDTSKWVGSHYIPVTLYLGGGEHADEALKALENLLEVSGLDPIYPYPPELGSWWKRFIAKLKSPEVEDELVDVLSRTKEALEVAYLDKPRSEIDLNRANAAAALLAVLEKDSQSTTLLFGNMLCLSIRHQDGSRQNLVLELSVDQFRDLQENLNLMKDPGMLLSSLKPPQLSNAGKDAADVQAGAP